MTAEQRDQLQHFIRQILAAVSNISLYTAGHPQVQRLMDRALASLEQAMGDDAELAMVIIDDTLITDNQPLEQSLFLDKFCRLLSGRGIGYLCFSQGVNRDELMALVLRLCRGGELKSSPHIRLGQAKVATAGLGLEEEAVLEAGEARELLSQLPQREEQVQLELHEMIRQGRRPHFGDLQRLVSSLVKVFSQEAETLMALAPLRALDEYTFTHSTNVCILNLAQAKALGIHGTQLHDIGIAALLHDVGKLFVPDEILKKPAQLSEEEAAIMRQHPVWGARYLLETPGVPQLAVICAFEHHMRYDRSGYPAVDGDWPLNLASQLTMIADTFDAVRTKRSYQQPHERLEALRLLQRLSGTALNPVLVRNFMAMFRQQWPGLFKAAAR